MKISKNCVNIVKKYEGCQLTAYKCPAGVWTIGYGTTSADKSITGITVERGTKITKEQAEKFLESSLNKKYALKVQKFAYNLNQNQFDALVSFAYNVGSIDGLTKNGTRSLAEVGKKLTAYNKANGKELLGLTRRRKEEQELFSKKPTVPPARLKAGSEGKDVINLQSCLEYLCYSCKIDGTFGKGTDKALKAFQKSQGLAQDGSYGAKTYDKMKKAMEKNK